MGNLTIWLWLALCGAALQLTSLGTHFYLYEGKSKDAWQGIPHTSDLLLFSAAVTIVLFVATALNRNPIRGQAIGRGIGTFGILASLQLGYRMVAPPFGVKPAAQNSMFGNSCLYYCSPSEAVSADLLTGIWIALIGCLAVAVGGICRSFSKTANSTPANPWVASQQTGLNPWLASAGGAALVQFGAGYTIFTFYTLQHVKLGQITWSGWLPTPHTSSMVLAVTVAVVGLVWAAARGRAPLKPAALGASIAMLGFVSASRILYRVLEPPFPAVRGPREIEVAAYVSLVAAVLIIVFGMVYAAVQREKSDDVAQPG